MHCWCESRCMGVSLACQMTPMWRWSNSRSSAIPGARRGHPASFAASRDSGACRRRETQLEAAASAFARGAAHAAAMPLGNLLDEAQAQAHATGLLGMAGQAIEGLEDALALRLGH